MKKTKNLSLVNKRSDMEEILIADPSRWVDYIGLCVDDSELVDTRKPSKKEEKDPRESIISAMGLYRPRRHKPVAFSSMKPGHSSKERRFVRSFTSTNRVHSAGGKGSKHKQDENTLNKGVRSLRRSGRPPKQLDDSFERYCRIPKSEMMPNQC